MTTRVLVRALGVLTVATAALGEYKVSVWHLDPNEPSGGYNVYDPNGPEASVVIWRLGSYGIAAYDDETWQPRDISSITVLLDDPNELPGSVTVSILPDPNTQVQTYGARTVNAIDLSGNYQEFYEGVVGDMIISGNAATVAPLVATDVAGDCRIGNPVDPASGYVGDNVVLDRLTGLFVCNYLEKDFTVDSPSTVLEGYAGDLVLKWGGLNATQSIAFLDQSPDQIWFYGESDIAGTVHCGHDLGILNSYCATTGAIQVDGSAYIMLLGDGNNCGLAASASITVGADVTGAIYAWPGEYCSFVAEGDIDVGGNVGQLVIMGKYGGHARIGGDVRFAQFEDDLLGSLHVEGDVTHQIWLGVDGWSGPADLVGELKIDGDVQDDPTTSAEIRFDVGSIPGALTIGGALRGAVYVPYGALSGEINCDDLTGQIRIGDDGQNNHHVTGAITVGGNLEGPGILVAGQLIRDGNINPFGGRVKINGSFGESTTSTISFTGMSTTGAFITVDYDGYDPNDRWGSYGSVAIGPTVYTGNAPAAHIFAITSCKGDANNDGSVNAADTDGMNKAIFSAQLYANSYPGLAGSRVFHCDLGSPNSEDCDGLVTQVDYNFFRRRWRTCSPLCGN